MEIKSRKVPGHDGLSNENVIQQGDYGRGMLIYQQGIGETTIKKDMDNSNQQVFLRKPNKN